MVHTPLFHWIFVHNTSNCTAINQQFNILAMNISCRVFNNTVQNVHQQQQHTIKVQNETTALSMNYCGKSFCIVYKTLFQLGNVGHLWLYGYLVALLHCTPYVTIHWHIHMVYLPLHLRQNCSFIIFSRRKVYFCVKPVASL